MLEELSKITVELVNNSTHCEQANLSLFGVKICVWPSYEWMHEVHSGGSGVSWAHKGGDEEARVEVQRQRVGDGVKVAHPLLTPFMSRDPKPLTSQPDRAPVAMATSVYREMSQLLWDKIFPFPQATQSLSVFFLYILLPSTSALACPSHRCLERCT